MPASAGLGDEAGAGEAAAGRDGEVGAERGVPSEARSRMCAVHTSWLAGPPALHLGHVTSQLIRDKRELSIYILSYLLSASFALSIYLSIYLALQAVQVWDILHRVQREPATVGSTRSSTLT